MSEIKLPLFILEKEIKVINLVEEYSKFLIFIEEFFDILEDEFIIWDIFGNRIRVTSLSKNVISFEYGANESNKLKESIYEYIGRAKNDDLLVTEDLVSLFKLYSHK